MDRVASWMSEQGWTSFAYQRATWEAYRAGRSGLVHAPTGVGKTYAAALGPMVEALEDPDTPPGRMIWLTPLRALATDTTVNLQAAAAGLGLNWQIEKRTGDTSASRKAKQRKQLPHALVTTPESLSLLIGSPEAERLFQNVRAVICDEWHELLASKRGVQTELCLARLRHFAPELRIWGLSATLGNTDQAMRVLLGDRAEQGVLIRGEMAKQIDVVTLLPETMERFPWAGHIGIKLVDQVVTAVDEAATSLIFTNTRSQSEIWFQALLKARPDWLGAIALHHGSLERAVRDEVEELLRAGKLKCVVCTSSLDLGVDFSPVERVFQVGSPKGIARLMQRAGRSGHQPGARSVVIGVPTNAFELVEFAAARVAAGRGEIESREPLVRTLDVLAQHLVTVGLGGGFEEEAMLAEVRTTHAFAQMTDQEWAWVLDFVKRGGETLKAYPHFAKLVPRDGRLVVEDRQIARMHRMSIGTITADQAVVVRFKHGKKLGTIEESFITRLKPGQCFTFAGRLLQLVRYRNMTAEVAPAKRKQATVPRWQGGRSPLSTQLAAAVREQLDGARLDRYEGAEMEAVRPILELQKRWSHLPAPGELLIESLSSRDGHHAFVFTMAGRLVHEGLGSLLAYRIAQLAPRSLTVTGNDYGIELLSPDPLELDETQWRKLLSTENLMLDLLACLNATGLARQRFRSIARVAGLVFQGYPGQGKSSRQLQASSDLFFDVFADFDPENLLLDQARREVLERELEASRLQAVLDHVAGQQLCLVRPTRMSPLAFPLWADRIREAHVTTEAWQDRVKRMMDQLETAANRSGNRTLK